MYENTLEDLRDCIEKEYNLVKGTLSPSEEKARSELIELMKEFISII